MELTGKRIGFAITGSFCTFEKVLPQVQKMTESGAQVIPILSYNAASSDTRFMKYEHLKAVLKAITGKEPIESIVAAEPIGPKKILDLLVIAPCTGNSLAKIANGISDTPVTLAAKSHLRNERPVLIAVSTNDALGANAKNIGQLLNTKHFYFVPMGQDSYLKKCTSLVADMDQIVTSAEQALEGKQIQPLFISPKEE